MDEKRKIAVYFANERRAVFDECEVEFRTGSAVPWAKEIEDHGGVIINWDNVCYIKAEGDEGNDRTCGQGIP